MPAGGLVTGGLIGLGGIGSLMGGKAQANAQQSIAEMQLAQQGQERQFAMGAAQPSTQDLQAMQQQLQAMQNTSALQSSALQMNFGLAQATNPAIMQSANNAYALMTGQQAPALQPYYNMLGQQKNEMESGLAQQFGSGWSSSSVGTQAMQNFGLQAANQTAQIQQGAIQPYLQATLAGNPNLPGMVNQAGSTLSGMNQGYFGMGTDLQKMMIGASEGTSLTPFSGANQVGSLSMGGTMGNLGSSMMGSGMNLAMLSSLMKSPGFSGGGGYAGSYGGGMGPGMTMTPG